MSEILRILPHETRFSEKGRIPFAKSNLVVSGESERTLKNGIKLQTKYEVISTINSVEKQKPFKIAGVSLQKPMSSPGGEPEFLEPLGLQHVLTQVANRGYKTDLFIPFDQNQDKLVKDIVGTKPNVVVFSTMTLHMKTGLSMARKIKQESPDTKIVFGGYHPSVVHSATPELLKDSPVDYWIVGEGEKTFPELVQSLERGENPNKVEGLAYYYNGKLKITPPRQRIHDLDNLGHVWRPEFIKHLKNHGLMYPAPSEQKGFASIDYSRGCLGGCEFCASPEVLGRNVSFHSAQSITNEIQSLHDKMGINTFFFTDLDFIQRGKNQERTSALLKELQKLQQKFPFYWEALGRISSISETGNYQILEEMHKAGCRKIAWGLESIDPQVLESMKKERKGDETMKALSKAEEAGILNTAFYIIGWHDFIKNVGDNKESILRDAQVLPHYPIHRLRITIATPLPGSQFYKICKDKGLLTDQNLEHYDTEHLVYKHPTLQPHEIENLRNEIYKQFYNSPIYKKRVAEMINHHPEYKKSFEEFLSNLRF